MSDYHVLSLFKFEFPHVASESGVLLLISPKGKSGH